MNREGENRESIPLSDKMIRPVTCIVYVTTSQTALQLVIHQYNYKKQPKPYEKYSLDQVRIGNLQITKAWDKHMMSSYSTYLTSSIIISILRGRRFYFKHSHSSKWFASWNVKYLLSLMDSWASASSLTNFKLAWKTVTFLALVTEKHFDSTLLWIQNQHLFFSIMLLFYLASGGKID